MQPCNRIYYSNVYWRLKMFQAAHRSSTGALNCICSLWFTYTCGDRPLSNLSGLLMMSGMPLETFSAFNKRWNNKFYYKLASCWLFLLIHTTMHGSMNIKFIWSSTCFGRHTAHHQEPKTVLAASGFAYVKGCWTCGCWTLMMGGISPETCWASYKYEMKFWYIVASC
jgi:hypothetical protein